MTAGWPVPPPPPRRSGRAALIRRLGRAKVELDLAQAKYDELAEQARTELGVGEHITGNTAVIIVRYRTWDKQKAREDYGDAICSMEVDLKLARLKLTGEQYEAYYLDAKPRVIVRVDSGDV
jgi:hypothetical protein